MLALFIMGWFLYIKLFSEKGAILLKAPVLHEGDYFEIEIEYSKNNYHKNNEQYEIWRYRYSVLGENKIYGYPCLIIGVSTILYPKPTKKHIEALKYLIKHRNSPNQSDDATKFIYYFRKSDMNLIAIRSTNPISSTSSIYVGFSPWNFDYNNSLGYVPTFPVISRNLHYRDGYLFQYDGTPISGSGIIQKAEFATSTSDMQKARLGTIRFEKNKINCVTIISEKYTCNWVPGQIWWAQCRSITHTTTSYKARLIRTSTNGYLNYPFPK